MIYTNFNTRDTAATLNKSENLTISGL